MRNVATVSPTPLPPIREDGLIPLHDVEALTRARLIPSEEASRLYHAKQAWERRGAKVVFKEPTGTKSSGGELELSMWSGNIQRRLSSPFEA